MIDRTITLPAPAKLNLFLHITSRREDGYHNLQTLFQFIDYCDSLTLQATSDQSISLNTNTQGIATTDNLVFRAAQLLQQTTGCALGAAIQLRKSLPAGAGLGGGSSDAATTLLALNHLWQLNLSLTELAALGLRLGADVPVFVHGQAAIAEGVGEQLKPFQPPEDWYLLLMPACHVETARLFADKYLTRNSNPITIRAISQGGGHNDFEPVTRRLFPLVDQGFAMLSNWGTPRLTGTGACLFNRYQDQHAANAAEEMAQHYLQQHALTDLFSVRIAKGVSRSPAHTALQQHINSKT